MISIEQHAWKVSTTKQSEKQKVWNSLQNKKCIPKYEPYSSWNITNTFLFIWEHTLEKSQINATNGIWAENLEFQNTRHRAHCETLQTHSSPLFSNRWHAVGRNLCIQNRPLRDASSVSTLVFLWKVFSRISGKVPVDQTVIIPIISEIENPAIVGPSLKMMECQD